MGMRTLIADEAFSFDKIAPSSAERSQEAVDADQTARIEALERENAEIKLYLVGLIRYMVSRRMIRQDDFLEYIGSLDRFDGKDDAGFDGPMDTVRRRDI